LTSVELGDVDQSGGGDEVPDVTGLSTSESAEASFKLTSVELGDALSEAAGGAALTLLNRGEEINDVDPLEGRAAAEAGPVNMATANQINLTIHCPLQQQAIPKNAPSSPHQLYRTTPYLQ
jgi:hypothetical protein